jgi:hypothetical protein
VIIWDTGPLLADAIATLEACGQPFGCLALPVRFEGGDGALGQDGFGLERKRFPDHVVQRYQTAASRLAYAVVSV